MTPDIWIALGVGAFVLVLFAVALLVPRKARQLASPSTDGKLDEVKRRLDEVERKQNVADHDIRNVRMAVGALATKDSVSAVAVQLAGLSGEVKGLVSSSSAATRSIGRIEDFMAVLTAHSLAEAKVGHSNAEAKGIEAKA